MRDELVQLIERTAQPTIRHDAAHARHRQHNINSMMKTAIAISIKVNACRLRRISKL